MRLFKGREKLLSTVRLQDSTAADQSQARSTSGDQDGPQYRNNTKHPTKHPSSTSICVISSESEHHDASCVPAQWRHHCPETQSQSMGEWKGDGGDSATSFSLCSTLERVTRRSAFIEHLHKLHCGIISLNCSSAASSAQTFPPGGERNSEVPKLSR